MQITSKTEYSLRALIEIAGNNGLPMSIRAISEHQNLPAKYLEHLFREMKKHGIVTSSSGSKGGYQLAKATDKITLNEIISSVEETPYMVYCQRKSKEHEFCIGHPCVIEALWTGIYDNIRKYMDSIKLSDILQNINGDYKDYEKNIFG
ncbi:MAG: Rrf2 family transcriptional regulator [Candidatus Cloacimonetes bacterium]|nr:Rrf2 family transcriptional regulator [Candidatus Cloacimonadota bacterium]